MTSPTNQSVDHVYTIDPAFATPKKVRDITDPFQNYITPYCSSKLKEIASKIRTNANKRFKMREEGGEVRLVFWSEMKQVSESAETKPSQRSQEGELTENQVDQLTKINRLAVAKIESATSQKRKKVEELMKSLEGLVRKRKHQSVQLKSLKKTNKAIVNQTSYRLLLVQTNASQQQIIKNVSIKIMDLSDYHMKITNCISEIPVIDQSITGKRMHLERLDQQLERCVIQQQRVISEAAPHSMINCTFLVGTLKQQIYILILQKAERGKQAQVEKTGNRSHKIIQKMARRSVDIECKDSSIAELRTFVTIYMHCRSLTLPNIVTLMNSLSFFAQEFKGIYQFSVFQMCVKNLIIGSAQMDQPKSESTRFKEPQVLKKKLVIIVRSEHQSFLKNIMRLFQRQGDDYCISLNQMKMKIEVSVEDETPLDREANKDLPLPEHNELRLRFLNLSHPS